MKMPTLDSAMRFDKNDQAKYDFEEESLGLSHPQFCSQRIAQDITDVDNDV